MLTALFAKSKLSADHGLQIQRDRNNKNVNCEMETRRDSVPMTSPLRFLFAASLLGNLVMGVALAFPQWLQSMGRAELPPSTSHQAELLQARETYKTLLEQRVPLDIAQRVLAASLPRPETHDSEYWLSSLRRQTLNEKERVALNSVLRDFLDKTVGPQAAESDAFVDLFRPLQGRFPFLPSQKQLELQRIWLAEKETLADAQAAGGIQMARVADVRSRTEAAVKQLLTAEEMREYELRESRTSQMLLSSGFDFTEKEFRDSALALLKSKDAQARYALNDTLATTLSPERLEEFRTRQQQSGQLAMEAYPSADVRVRALPAGGIIEPARTN